MQHACTLIVLTLLQLCRAEIPEALPEWYAANLINDAGYPKPITEIFTTPDSFSSKNPIIVTSTGYSSETEGIFSTLATSTQTQPTSTELPPSSDDTTQRVIPLEAEERPLSSRPNDSSSQVFQVPPQQENRPSLPTDMKVQTSLSPPREVSSSSPQPIDTSRQMYQPQPREISSSSPQPLDTSRQVYQPPPREISSSSPQPLDTSRQVYQPPPREISSSSPQPLDMSRQMYQPPPQQIQVLVAQPQIQPSQQIQPLPQAPPAPIPPSPQMPPAPNPPCPPILMQTQPVNQQQTTGQPNYFLIYQQAPLSIQQYPESASQSRQSLPSTTQTTTQSAEIQRTTQEAIRTTTTTQPSPTTEVETRPTQSSTTYISTTSPSATAPRNIRQQQIGYWQDPTFIPGARLYNPPIGPAVPLGAFQIPCLNASSPGNNATTPSTSAQRQKTGLTIRVTAPRGSITNIKINPTTTKKPTSRRPQRKKGNNYNNCVDSCKGKKEPLCAAPLAVLPIDPNKLRGFPSICHLACHNSFRKNQPYEKVMDGRCSRLRTRIRTFDKNKLKREELNKAQYTVMNNVPETIVQVIQNERSGGF